MTRRPVLAVLLAVLLAAAIVMAGGWGAWVWLSIPRTPQEMSERRCTQCHRLPNMEQFGKRNMKGIVRAMREKNGADKVITEEEAAVIVKYLEEKARW